MEFLGGFALGYITGGMVTLILISLTVACRERDRLYAAVRERADPPP
jgi:hypothetical protein